MKLLSLWQPWASFVELGYKSNETRSWATSYRGLLAIHAAKNTSALEDADDILQDAGFDMSERTTVGGTKWPLGQIVAICELTDCVRTESVKDKITRRERAMGDYSDGRFAWVLQNIRRLKPGIPFRGMQGLKPLSAEGIAEIEKQFPDLIRAAAAPQRDLF